jgi:hypothetical protein
VEGAPNNAKSAARPVRRRRGQPHLGAIDTASFNASILPPGAKRWSAQDHARYAASVELLQAAQAQRVQHPRWPMAAVVKSPVARRGKWARERHLVIGARSLQRYATRCNPNSIHFDGNRDGRGRHGRRLSLAQRRALTPFFRALRDPATVSVKVAWETAGKEATAAGVAFPSLSTARVLAAELGPGAVRVKTCMRRALLRWRREHGQGGGK